MHNLVRLFFGRRYLYFVSSQQRIGFFYSSCQSLILEENLILLSLFSNLTPLKKLFFCYLPFGDNPISKIATPLSQTETLAKFKM